MRSDFTNDLDTARNKKANAPATLLKLEWPAQPLGYPALTLRLADRAGIVIDSNTWFPLIDDPGDLSQLASAQQLESDSVAEVEISVVNLPTALFTPSAPFAQLFRKYRPEACTATLYQWFVGESLAPEDLAILFVARLADPIHFNSSLCTFTLVDIAFAFGQVQVGAPVTLTDYPLAPETSVGKMMPIVVGDVARVPAVPVRKVAETRVRSVVLSGGSSVTVADTTDFPASGSIVINDDVIAYTSKNSTQFLGCTGINEFHYSDDVVLESVTGHRYLLSDPAYPIKSISAVRAGGHLADSGDYTVDLENGEVVFTDKPKLTDSIDTKFLQAQMDEAASGNNATNPTNAFIPNSPATYAELHQGATPLALKQTDNLPNIGDISSVLVRVEHFMEEKLTTDSLTVEIPGIGELGELPPPAADDAAVVAGNVDITHDTLTGTLTFPVTDPQHEHALPNKTTITQNAIGGVSANFVAIVAAGNNTNHTITFPSFSGTLEKAEYSVSFELGSITPDGGPNDPYLQLAGTGTGPGPASYQCWTKNLSSGLNTYNFAGEINKEDNTIVMTGGFLTAINAKITSALRIITLATLEDVATESTGVSTSSSGSLAQTTGTKTLNATAEKTSQTVVKYFDITSSVTGWDWFLNKEIHVIYNGSADGRTAFIIHVAFEIEYARRRISFTDDISADVEGVVDDGAGTITGTADALVERPDHVFKWSALNVLSRDSSEINNAAMSAAATFYDANGGGYALAGVIQEQIRLRDLWSAWGRSCRSYFYWDLGEARIRVRPLNSVTVATAPDKVIATNALRVDESGMVLFDSERGAYANIANKIDLKYLRSWSDSGADAYEAVSSVSDSNSIARYGARERPDLFLFDWVRSETMAGDLATFYLNEYAEPLDVCRFELFLDHMELERGDIVQVNSPLHDLDSVLCLVLGAGRVIGSGKARRMDSAPITARVMRGLYANDGLGLQALGSTGLGGVEAI